MKVRLTTAAAVIAAAILAVPASAAVADDAPPVTTTTDAPTLTQPVTTADDPAIPVVTIPSDPVPVNLPVPGIQVQTLLLKQVREQLVLTRRLIWGFQSQLGRHKSPGGNIWNLGSPEVGRLVLRKWQERANQLRNQARQRIQQDRREVEHMLQVTGRRPVVRKLATSGNILDQLRYMNRLRNVTYRHYVNPPHASELSCIHYNPRVGHGEGAWTANTGNGFYGGLQMNLGFQSTYGGWLLRTKGTADHWTPLEQMWVAAKAVDSGRGFSPWPNTGRACGLIH